jgi:hypothetical protein
MSDPAVSTVEAQYDPDRVRQSLANNRRSSWIVLAVGAAFTFYAAVRPSAAGEMPAWLAALFWVFITSLVWLYLRWMQYTVHVLTTGRTATERVTALAVSPTGVRVSVGAEVPWSGIVSVNLINTRERRVSPLARPMAREGYALGGAALANIGLGRTQVLVLLRDGKRFAESLANPAPTKRVRMWPGGTPEAGDVTVLLDPMVPVEQIQPVLDALVAGCARNGVPLTSYGKGTDALAAMSDAAKS